MIVKDIKGGLTHQGKKWDKVRQVAMPENLEEVKEVAGTEEVLVSFFNESLRRHVAEELREEIRIEQGFKAPSKKDIELVQKYTKLCDKFGIDYDGLETVQEFEEALGI